jgi:hypothetical protein
MPDTVEIELARIVSEVAFPSAGTVTLAGRTTAYAAHAAAATPGVTAAAGPPVVQLQQLLYEWCYCRRFDAAPTAPTPAPVADAGLVPALSAANASRDRWDAGWQIRQMLPSGQIVAAKGAMTRIVWAGEFLALGSPGLPPQPGVEISLYAPKESLTIQPGFYYAFGEARSDQEDEFSVVRLYWNVRASGAAGLIAAITAALNSFAVPFRFKCLSTAAFYDRADTGVLYLAKRHYRIAAELLAEIYCSVRPLLDASTPLFSKRLAEGLAFAENPKSGESFGMHRCRLVAEAVCNAHARGVEGTEARLSEVKAVFAAAGLSLERPFLNAGSVDRYEFPLSRAA